MTSLQYAVLALWRGGLRSLAYLLGLGLAIALFSTTLFFIDASARTLTQRAIAPVYLDFQGRSIGTTPDVTTLIPRLQGHPGISAIAPFASSAIVVAPSGAVATPATAIAAQLLAVPTDYPATFPVLRVSAGTFSPGSALIGESLAARLHLAPGDTLSLMIPGMAQPYAVHISGTVNTDNADPLFSGPNSTPEGAFNGQPDVVVLDYAVFARDLSTPLQAAADKASQQASNATPTGLPVLDRQIHLRIDRARLPANPAEAQIAIGALVHSLERLAPGQIRIADHLTDALTNATKDVVAARLLFVFLGLPGILLAAYLSRAATQLVTEAQRREIALLRARGLTPTQVLTIMGWTTALVALLGAACGIAIGAASIGALFGINVFAPGAGSLVSILGAIGLAIILGGLGVFLPAQRMIEGEVNETRRALATTVRPLWLRFPLDLALLAAGGLALWLSVSSKTAGTTEGAAVSLGTYAFLGPLLLWSGAALLFLRITDALLRRPAGPWRGAIGGLVSRGLRQRSQQSAGLAVLLALALSFGVATTVFAATFDASRRAEARYMVGSDLRVTPALLNPQAPSFASTLRAPGVQAVTPVFVNNNVLLGAQTQTVYGIDRATFGQATTVQDTFFVNDTARAALQRLTSDPQGLLVSNELAKSYNIQVGDPVMMRIPTPGGTYTEVTLHTAGIFLLFPTSSQNADLIVNQELLTTASQNPNAAFFLIKTDGAATTNDAVTHTITQRLSDQHLAARIESATRVITQDQSSLVGLNLAGLALIDQIYAVLIIAIGLGVFLLGNLLERRREFGTLLALGAARDQISRLILGEGAILILGGMLGGAAIGALLAWQYAGFLPSIFSVTLPVFVIPWPDLARLVAAGAVGVALAAGFAIAQGRRLWPAEVLREG